MAQTNDPIELERCSFDSDKTRVIEGRVLPLENMPWGVCLGRKSGLTWTQDDWTREAIAYWNTGYKNYLLNKYGTIHVYGVPEKLFTVSCNRKRYNIIYLEREDLGTKAAGYYEAVDVWYDFLNFYGKIVINKVKSWPRSHFINIMIHELGHALGLVHVPNESYSDFMIPSGFGCKNYHIDKICEFTAYDFEKVLEPYDPPTRAENDRNNKSIADKNRACMTGALPFCACEPCGPNGVPL